MSNAHETMTLFNGSYANPIQPLWASALTGVVAGPNLQVSSLTTNSAGAIILDPTAPIVFDRPSAAPSIIKMANNFTGAGAYSENISIENNTGVYYDNLALGNLIVYGDNIATGNTVGCIGILTQHSLTTATELITRGFYTSSIFCSSITADSQNISTVNISSITADSGIIGGVTLGPDSQLLASTILVEAVVVSTINGYPYNGGTTGVPPNILVSTIAVNSIGSVRFTADGTTSGLVTSGMFFDKSTDIPQTYSQALKMATNRTAGLLGVSTIENISITHVDDIKSPPGLYYDTFALGDLLVYGTNNPKQSTVGQVALLTQFEATTDLSIITTGLHTSSITASTINIRTANISTLFVSSIVDYTFLVSSATITELVTKDISSLTGQIPLFSASTLAFNPSLGGVNLGGIDLGMGGFLGGLTGQLVSGALTTTIAGAALGTGLAGLILPRTNNYISYPGSLSTFQMVNATTQLQFSTLGQNTSTFTRFVSSIDGGTITPGLEYIISSVIAPGTVCVRSFSDPVNLANASTFTSTVQAFGYWNALPINPPSTISTVYGNFYVNSTLQAYNANFQSSIVASSFATLGNISGGNIFANSLSTLQSVNTSTLTATKGNISSMFLSSINGQIYPPVVTPSQQFSTLYVSSLTASTIQAGSISSANGSISSLNVSSINGFTYNPGGGGGGGNQFSTLFVSSLTVSTIQAGSISSANASISTMNIGQFSALSTNIGGVSISSATVSALDVIASSFIGKSGVFTNPPNAGLTFIDYRNLQTTGTVTGPVFSGSSISYLGNLNGDNGTIQNMNISSLNGQRFPTPYASTVFGNFTVTSTLTASSINGVHSITATNLYLSESILANGNITGLSLIADNGINCIAGTIVAPSATIGQVAIGPAGALTCSNAVIDGVTISPPGLIVASNVNLSQNLTVSTINGAQYPPTSFPSTVIGNFNVGGTLTANRINCSTSVYANTTQFQGVFGGFLQATAGISGANITASAYLTGTNLSIANSANIPAITGVTTINGVAYPPPVTNAISTFNQLFTSSLVANNVTTNGINTGYISSLQANIGGVSISSLTVTAQDVTASSFLGAVGLFTNLPNPGFTFIDYKTVQTSQGLFSTILSSNAISTQALYVSSINNLVYPPPAIALVSTFSTITVSSLATIGLISTGTITGTGAVIGGVTIGPAGAVSATLVAGTQVNANSMLVQTDLAGNSIVATTGYSYFSTMILSGPIGGGGLNPLKIQNGFITGTSNVNYELDIISSCTIGGNLTVKGAQSTIGTVTISPAVSTTVSFLNFGGGYNLGDFEVDGSLFTSTIKASKFSVYEKPTSTLDITTDGLYARNPVTNESVQVANFIVNLIGPGASAASASHSAGGFRVEGSGASPLVSILTSGELNGANQINPELNTGTEYLTGNQRNTTIIPGSPIAGYGTAAMTYTKIQSGQYSWGPVFNFTNGINYRVPNLELAGAYPTYLTFAVQSRGNVGGNFDQIFGTWNVYVGYTDAVAGVLQPTYNQVTIFSHNCSIVFTINSLNQTVLINVVSNVGGPHYVTDVSCSWTVQPLFPY